MLFIVLISLVLVFTNLYLRFFEGGPQPFRRSAVASLIIIFLFIAITTELLSFVRSIQYYSICVVWIAFDVILLVTFRRLIKANHKGIISILKKAYQHGLEYMSRLGAVSIVLIGSLLLATFIVCVVSTPNNLDSLSYHISRIGYWIQNRSVEHYPSHIERSVSFSPFSEYVHLHIYILTDSLRFLQLLQWLCLIGILMYVSLISELLFANLSAIRIALSFTVTIPIVVLESMTTQNDLVVAFFIIGTAFYVIEAIKKPEKLNITLMAVSIALGMMTKGTFIFYVTPFGMYLIFALFKKKLWKNLIAAAVLTIAFTLICNFPSWKRTYNLFDSPFGNMSQGNQNASHTPAAIASSVSKNTFLHLGFVSPGNRYNKFMEARLNGFHDWLGLALNDPGMGMRFKMNRLNFNEDFAHNFLSAWLIILSLILACFRRVSKLMFLYICLTITSFILFSSFISYQIYGSRLHIPFFVLMGPAVGIIISSSLSIFRKSIPVILWINVLPFALLSASHPIISTAWFFSDIFPFVNRIAKMNIEPEKQTNLMRKSIFETSPEDAIWGEQWPEIKSMVVFVDSVKAKDIGFYFREGSFDYGYQFVLRKDGRRFEHVLVRNASQRLEKFNFSPDCIISEVDLGNSFKYKNVPYLKQWARKARFVYNRNVNSNLAKTYRLSNPHFKTSLLKTAPLLFLNDNT